MAGTLVVPGPDDILGPSLIMRLFVLLVYEGDLQRENGQCPGHTTPRACPPPRPPPPALCYFRYPHLAENTPVSESMLYLEGDKHPARVYPALCYNALWGYETLMNERLGPL